jgi:hypothetical protein
MRDNELYSLNQHFLFDIHLTFERKFEIIKFWPFHILMLKFEIVDVYNFKIKEIQSFLYSEGMAHSFRK